MTGSSMLPPRIRIGTSGWHYRSWVGRFYPPGTPARCFLSCYGRQFDTVEINNSFYRLPSRPALTAWREGTPAGFLFACKASRFITHMKKLSDPQESVRRFFGVVDALEEKLGPILFQLPPRWRVNVERLRDFLEALPSGYRYAFELRDESWFVPAVYEALAAHDAALCFYDLAGRQSPLPVTTGFVYLRLHGPGGPYQGSYDDAALGQWAKRLCGWRGGGRQAYCYFDNDERAYAALDALRLIGRLETG